MEKWVNVAFFEAHELLHVAVLSGSNGPPSEVEASAPFFGPDDLPQDFLPRPLPPAEVANEVGFAHLRPSDRRLNLPERIRPRFWPDDALPPYCRRHRRGS